MKYLTVSALNSTHPDRPVNILHTLAVSDHCSIILPHLINYIDHSLYQQRDYQGDTTMKAAISSGRLDNAKVLVDAQRIALKEKGYNGQEVKQKTANTTNIKDNKGQTPLHVSAQDNRYEFIKFLVSLGADTTIKDNKGYKPLHYASSDISSNERKTKSIIALVTNSEELNTPNKDGDTPLDILRNTQKPTWGKYQELELIKLCNKKSRGTSCVVM